MVSSCKKPSPDLSLFAADDSAPVACDDLLPRPHRGELYLSVRMPMSWVERATPLPGRAWQLACALWFEAACQKKRATVSLPLNTRRRFGLLSRHTFYRALAALKSVGLIRVESRSGQRLRITIIPPA
jgi:hypothetical protein